MTNLLNRKGTNFQSNQDTPAIKSGRFIKFKNLIVRIFLIIIFLQMSVFVIGFCLSNQSHEENRKSDYNKAEISELLNDIVNQIHPSTEPTREPGISEHKNANYNNPDATQVIGTIQDNNIKNNSSAIIGVMPKDYEPKGKEPTWIEIISYCEVQMPKIIGYDASISLA